MHSYGAIAAHHYAAYRPPLHARAIDEALGRGPDEALGQRRFAAALDIGCGAGWSTIALAPRCDTVIGVDPSQAMLDRARAAPGVAYRLGDGSNLPIGDATIDLVSLAGVLPYLHRAPLIAELRRVCRAGALILPYDFRVEFAPLWDRLSLDGPPDGAGYDHSRTLRDDPRIETLTADAKRVTFEVTTVEAAHLLLASETRFAWLADAFLVSEPEAPLLAALARHEPTLTLEATLWVAAHRFRDGQP